MTKLTLKKSQFNTQLQHIDLINIIQLIKSSQSIKTQIDAIRQTTTKQQKTELKNNLPQFFCAEYADLNGGVSLMKEFTHSGMMVFDLDNLEAGQAEDYTTLLLQSPLSPFVKFTFKSPSGGLKFALQTTFNGKDNEWYKFAYKKLVDALVKVGLPCEVVDTQTCNLNRGTYLSHDQNANYFHQTKAIDIDRWKEAFEETQKIMKTLRMVDQLWSEYGEIDEQKARATMEATFNTLSRKMSDGNRHSLIHIICVCCYERGLTEQDATQYLNRLKASGNYTESMSTQNKASDSYKSWKVGGGCIKKEFIKSNKETRNKVWSKSISNIIYR
ncbi:BT4734/BF3469 family protein [Photobacterium damselae]|uniref:BT4734/BF3469 family protein n=1 Tax=Photobacterium damselae TaxID=38293 RepID=UPI003D7DC416